MHSLNHPAYGRAVAAERLDAWSPASRRPSSVHPPPVRSRVAYWAARAARRLDLAAARRAVA